jgi:hypothetical protein
MAISGAQYIVRCHGTVDTAKKKPPLTSPSKMVSRGKRKTHIDTLILTGFSLRFCRLLVSLPNDIYAFSHLPHGPQTLRPGKICLPG